MVFPPCGHNFNHIIAHFPGIVKRIMVFSAVFRRGRRPRRPARPSGAGFRKSEIFGGPSGRPAPTVLFGCVGAIHESPDGVEWHRNISRHCEAVRPWQSVTPAAQRAARPQRGRRDADCHVGLRPPRNDRGGRWPVPFRRGAAVIVGMYCGTVITVPYMGFPSPVSNGMKKRPPGFREGVILFLFHKLTQSDAVEEIVDHPAQLCPHGAAVAVALAGGIAADGA